MRKAQIIDLKIRTIAQKERDALGELVIELRELDSIRGYEELGYNNLFDYLTSGVGYSAGAAQRRIDAARLAKDVLDLGERIQSGALDLHHVTAVSKAVRQANKLRKISVAEKCEIIEKIKGQSEARTQKVVAEFFDIQVITETKRSVQKDESVRFEITLSREQAELIERAQALVSHAVPSKNLAEFLEYVSRKIIQQKAHPARERNAKSKRSGTIPIEAASTAIPVEAGAQAVTEDMEAKAAQVTATMAAEAVAAVVPGGKGMMAARTEAGGAQTIAEAAEGNAAAITATMAVNSCTQRVPESLHRKVRSEQPICMRCGSAWFAQTDHKRARWMGGTNARDNLQTLCGPCNRAKYRREIRNLQTKS